jgi:Sulfotransferase family
VVDPRPETDPTGAPDFVGVGAQRSGTSWWFSCLLRHPQIEGPTGGEKELHYFDPYYVRSFGASDIAGYHAKFPEVRSVRGGMLRGEWTPRYMYDFWTPRLLAMAAPQARLLVMLRDPLERYRSGVELESRLFGRDRARGVATANTALARSRYHEQLNRLLDYFPRSQMLVLQYEQCSAETERQFERTLAFLGISDPAPEGVIPSRPAGQWMHKRELPDYMRDGVVEELRDDVHLVVSSFPEIDIGLWPNFAAVKQEAEPRSERRRAESR